MLNLFKNFKKPSLLFLISSLLVLAAGKSQAHIRCPIRILGTTNDKCPHIHKPDLPDLSVEAWGEAGRVAYQSAAATMKKRSPRGESLDPKLKEAFRPHFGSLVDRVRLHWGTSALDTWSAGQIGINLSGTESLAQAYGHDIYIDQQKPSSYSPALVELIAHEMVHSSQYEKWGSSLSNFGYHYFKEYKKSGRSYSNNSVEKDAHQRAEGMYRQVYAALNKAPTIAFNVTVHSPPKKAIAKATHPRLNESELNQIQITTKF